MQKIFIVVQDIGEDINSRGNIVHVNQFIKNGGKIISVHPQHVSGNDERGRWLVVAENNEQTDIKL